MNWKEGFRVFAIAVALTWGSVVLRAQNPTIVKDTLLTQDGKLAVVQYTARTGKNDEQLMDGPYALEFHTRDSLSVIGFTKEKWSGAYKSGARSGDWTFQKHEHHYTIEDIENFTVSASLLSKVSQLKGTYENQLPTGTWAYETNLYQQGQLKEKLEEANFTFSEGGLNGKFQYQTPGNTRGLTITGLLSVDGIMDGEWIFTYAYDDSAMVQEVRKYQKGFLLSLAKINTTTNDTILNLAWADVAERLKAIEEGNSQSVSISSKKFGLAFDLGYETGSQELEAQKDGNQHLATFLARIADMDTLMRYSRQLRIGTARFKNKLTPAAIRGIREIKTKTDSIMRLVQTVESYSMLDLNHQRSDSLAAAYQYFISYRDVAAELRRLVRFMASDEFQYADASVVIHRFSDFFPSQRVIKYYYDHHDTTKTIVLSPARFSDLDGLHARVEAELNLMQQAHAFIQKEITKILQSDEIEALEEEIQRERNEFEKTFTTMHPVADPVGSLIRYIYSTFDEQISHDQRQAYSEASTFSEKSMIGLAILDMYRTLKNVPYDIVEIYKEKDRIRELYTETKFDPYTFNYDFKVIKKRKLYEKGAEELFAYKIRALRTETDYTKVQDRINEVRDLHARMIELAEEDTRKLERKIKSIENPEEIAAALNL